MSTNYLIIEPKKTFEQFREDIKADKVPGLSHSLSKQEKPDSFCITDGDSFLWVTGKGLNYNFDRYGMQSSTEDIIEAFEEYANPTDIVDEHDERYDELMED
jgi:hypothetical protein